MILGPFSGLLVLIVLLGFAYAFSLAITFWFLSIPLFCLWLWWMAKRNKRRPPINARAQASLDRHNAWNAWEKQISKDQRAGRR